MKVKPLCISLTVAFLLVLGLSLIVPSVGAQPPPGSEAGPGGALGATDSAHRVSDSPWLQLPEDLQNWPPILPPEPGETGRVEVEDPTAVVVYNVITGETIQIPSQGPLPEAVESGLRTALPYSGLLPAGVQPDSVFPPDDRSRVTSTSSYPWRTVTKLFMTFPSGASGGCSGAIIGCPDGHGYHILTAGHCVFSHDEGGWATSVRVVPGLDATYMPYNYAWATYLRSYTGWTDSEMTEHDWALVTLDRNVGDYTGWMGRMTGPSGHSWYTGGLNTAGYPCNTYHATRCPYPKTPTNSMWWDFDSGRTANDNNHWYWMDTQGGQSGSPVWRLEGSDRYILTVHTSGDDGSGSNHGTRLNNDKYDRIYTWCNADTPPTDRADLLDDGQTYSGFSPTTVAPGITSFNVWSDVRNVGTASSGGFYVAYYASTNTTISTADYLIGSDYVSSIAPFNWRDSDWSGTFNTSLPDGSYWVGWIIDSTSTVTEFDEGNNTAYKSSYKLLVDGTPPSNPTSATETHGAPNNAWQNTVSNPAFTWSGASDGSGSGVAGYNVYWGSSPSGTSSAWTTSASYDPPAVPSPSVRYLRVRTKDNAGNASSWKTLFTFKYDASAPSNPTSATETHGAPNNAWQRTVGDPSFTWSGASDGSGSGVAGYYLYWGSSPSGTSSTWTTGTSYNPPAVSSPSVYYLRVQTKDNAGNTSSWTTLFTFKYDASPPSNPSSVSSPSHTVAVWSNDNTVDVNWSGASDGSGSGVNGYSYVWTTSASTVPDTTVDTTGSSTTSPALGDNGNWHFHIRTRDNAGNWNGGAVHLGPFRIDTAAPSNPTSASETHGAPDNAWQNTVSDPAFTWSGASDGSGSGVAGYNVYWGSSPSGTSSTWTTSASYDPPAVSSPSVYYLRVRTKDNAGNTSSWKTLFTFKLDASAPSNPTSATETHGATDNTWQKTVSDPSFTWSGASDGSGSGVAGYYVYWGSSPSGTSATWTTSASYDPPAVSSPSVYYLRVQTKDNAGNTSSWKTLFTFKYDASPPSNPSSVSSPSHTVAVWSSDNTVDVKWSGASDGSGSGVNGYSYVWTTFAGTDPDTTVDTTSGSTTSPPLSDGDNWYFHIMTVDSVGNWAAEAVHAGPYQVDTSIPSCKVDALPATQKATFFVVTWSGDDAVPGSGLDSYDVQYRVGSGGDWKDWLLATVLTSGTFGPLHPISLEDGETYYFRCRARDVAGNLGVYPGGDGDTWTTINLVRIFLPVIQR